MQSRSGDKPVWSSITASLIAVMMATVSAYTTYAGERQTSENPTVQDTLTLDIAGQINPEGIRFITGGFRRWVLETDNDGEHSRYMQTGLGLEVSPAYVTASACVEWQPAPFLNLSLEYDLIRYLGAFTGLLSFPDKDSRYGDAELDALEGREETATGRKLSLRPSFYAKAGQVIVMNCTDLAHYRFNGQGPYFMEIEYDTLLRDGDFLIDNSTSFFFPVLKGEGGSVMYLGPYYNITRAHDSGITRQRAGAQMYWIIADTRWDMGSPRVYSQATFFIQDRNRRGEISLAVGFSADFDL